MKKISLLSLVVAVGLSVSAQDGRIGSTSAPTLKTPIASATRFGLRAGVNLSTLNTNGATLSPSTNKFVAGNDLNTENKTSFHASVFANIPLGGVIRFQPEVGYSSQGSKLSTGGTNTRINYEQDLGYIAVPLMLQAQTTGGFFVEAGPQLSYLIGGKINNELTNVEYENEQDLDRFDIGASVGLGYLSRVGLGINARYNFGLANIINEGDSDGGPELKNRVIQIGLVYQFGANK